MGNRNFRQFPSPLALGRTTGIRPALRESLLAPFVDVEDVPIDIDEDGIARPRPRARPRPTDPRPAGGGDPEDFDTVARRRRRDEFAGRPGQPRSVF